jgi:hypothetical protein
MAISNQPTEPLDVTPLLARWADDLAPIARDECAGDPVASAVAILRALGDLPAIVEQAGIGFDPWMVPAAYALLRRRVPNAPTAMAIACREFPALVPVVLLLIRTANRWAAGNRGRRACVTYRNPAPTTCTVRSHHRRAHRDRGPPPADQDADHPRIDAAPVEAFASRRAPTPRRHERPAR